MAGSIRTSLIGLLLLSLVGCSHMNKGDVASTGIVVVGLGILAAVLLLAGDDDDDDKDKKRDHRTRDDKGGHKGDHHDGRDRGNGHAKGR